MNIRKLKSGRWKATGKRFNVMSIKPNLRKNLKLFMALDDDEHFLQRLERNYPRAKEKKVKHWLFDFSRNYQLSENDQQWLDTTFFPSLMIALGPDNYIGMVVPKLTYRKMFQEAGQIGMQTYNSFIKLKTFCSSPKATRWLGTQTRFESYFAL